MINRLGAMLVAAAVWMLIEMPAIAATGDYLKYQEPAPAAVSSPLGTVAYVLSLLATFAAVIFLAIFASKFIGQKMGRFHAMGDNRILYTLPLGANRAVQLVEFAGKFFILGVTEHSISLLKEINSPEEMEKLKGAAPSTPQGSPFDQLFEQQLSSLKIMSQKFPTVFRQGNQDDTEGKR